MRDRLIQAGGRVMGLRQQLAEAEVELDAALREYHARSSTLAERRAAVRWVRFHLPREVLRCPEV